MADFTVTAANVSADEKMGSIVRNYQASGSGTVGDSVYLDSDGKVLKSDADGSLAASRAVGIVVNTTSLYGDTTFVSGDFVSVCVFGPVYGFSGMAEGTYGWVSTTAGKVADAAPATAYDYILGQVHAADVFFVHPGIENPVSVA